MFESVFSFPKLIKQYIILVEEQLIGFEVLFRLGAVPADIFQSSHIAGVFHANNSFSAYIFQESGVLLYFLVSFALADLSHLIIDLHNLHERRCPLRRH